MSAVQNTVYQMYRSLLIPFPGCSLRWSSQIRPFSKPLLHVRSSSQIRYPVRFGSDRRRGSWSCSYCHLLCSHPWYDKKNSNKHCLWFRLREHLPMPLRCRSRYVHCGFLLRSLPGSGLNIYQRIHLVLPDAELLLKEHCLCLQAELLLPPPALSSAR